MKRRYSAATAVVLLATALLTSASFGVTQIWQDGDFPEDDWDLISWYAPLDSGLSEATLSFTIGHGGNPGAHRTAGVSLGGDPDDGAMLVQINNQWTWDPAVQGPVTGIDAALDFLVTSAVPTRIGIAVEQDGNLYLHVVDPLAADDTWTTHAAPGLTALDFPPIDPGATGQPDFTVNGSELRFGFATGQLAVAAAGQTNFSHGVDNVNLTLTADPVSAVRDDATPARLAPPVIQPNPFNPRTEITFEMPAAGLASLRIFDLRGRLVRTLESGRLDPGLHRVIWKGENDAGRSSASGIYLAVLQTQDARVSRRLTLAR